MSTKPVKVLFIYGDVMKHGGIERVMMNYFMNINPEKVHIDFVVQGFERGAFDMEIESRGSKIFYLPKVSRHPIAFVKELKGIFKSKNYQIIHTHCDAMNYRILKLADKCGIPIRISHSHNTNHILKNRIKYLFYEYSRMHLYKYANVRWACSEEAGEWLYCGKKYEVIPNAIDVEKFQLNKEKRAQLRKKYGIAKDDIVLGNIGRFDRQKNHKFLLKVCKKLFDKNENYRLILIGDGRLRNKIEKKIEKYGLQGKVILAGTVPDPESYYNMMDLFVFPSLFEGYGIVLMEAEANGLYCIASDRIPRAAAVAGHIRFCGLRTQNWCWSIEDACKERKSDALLILRESNLNIEKAAEKVEQRYLQLYEEFLGESNV